MSQVADTLSFLRSLALFRPWGEDLSGALEDLAARSEVWTFSAGDLVRFPDEGPGGPLWVMEGCLAVLENQAPRFVGVREKLEAPAGLWVRGQTAGRYLQVPEASWRAWLAVWPLAAGNLGEVPPPPLPKSLFHSPLVLEPGETPVRLFRKAPLFLVRRALVPWLFFLIFLGFGTALQFGFQGRVPALALWVVPGLGMAVSAALVGLVAWEWSTSVLVVTDRSVILRQTDVWVHRSDFEKLALDRLRETVFSKQGLVDTLFGLVDLELEGDSARGRLVFRGLAHDSAFLGVLGEAKAKRAQEVPTRQAIRRALADRAGGARTPRLERPPAKRESRGPRVHRLSWRTERGNQVRFRRHPWILVQRCLPWAGWTVLTAFLALVAGLYRPEAAGVAAGIGFLAALGPLGKMGLHAWDWAHDWLAVQGEKIVLVRRKPLWFGEVRQEGDLDQVQEVGVRKSGLAALILDFGTVTVSLGASDPFVFDHASHPEWVQQEIFHRKTLLAQDRERRETKARLDETIEVLDTWDEARNAGYFPDKEKEFS